MAGKKKAQGRFRYKDCPSGLDEKIFYLIRRRRLQMLIYSYLYYKLDNSILHDRDFDKMALELKELQKNYPEESKAVELYEEFKNWDGTTGYDLPLYLPFVEVIALRVLEEDKKYTEGNRKVP
ncbi:MAG: hypothetical protein ABF633_03365 [Clostridium sp.]|uniref:DNA ligase LigA-related protein n=1 Tax=Clostridium sp. TaxID=1506 RepID=UPI0039E88CDC